MKRWLATCLILAAVSAEAQQHFMARLNHSGIMALMRASLQYNNRGTNSAGFKIPAGVYSFKIPRAQVASNPIIRLVSEVSDVNLVRDYPFYIYNSQINVVGEIDQTSLRHTVSNQTAQGFNLQVSFNVPQLRMTIPEISLCEKKAGARCGNGLKASFRNSSIALRRGSVIRVTGNFRVDINNSQARMRLMSATSNLGTRGGAQIEINAGSLTIPPVTVTVNGQSAQLDTSSLRGQLLGHTTFLAQKLLGFAGDFIAEDLAAMVNRTLRNECVPTQLNVVNMEPRPAVGYPLVTGIRRGGSTFGARLQQDAARLIKSMRFDLALASLRTPESRHLELRANGSLRINGKRWQLNNKLSNRPAVLPALNLDALSPNTNNFSVAVSEPAINAALAALRGTGLLQEILESSVDSRGLTIFDANVHLRNNRFYAVAMIQVDLREINSDGVLAWIKNRWAAWVERNNNNARLFFPMQFEIIPQIGRGADGGQQLFLRVNSPFASATVLRNDFGYATNINQATASVREGVISKIRDAILPHVNQQFHFPIQNYLNQPGMSFKLKDIRMVNSAYMLVSMDMERINLAALQGNARSCR